MPATTYLIQNGKTLRESNAAISPSNRSFRYGDGCFETMKVSNGKLLLGNYHFDRLFSSLALLQFDVPAHFTPAYLQAQVLALATKNNHHPLARVRLTIYRGDGGLYDPQNHTPNYIIQTWSLNPSINNLNENGLIIGVFEDAKKVCDRFSAIKSNNFLGYAMAALWVKREQLNDAILLNPCNRVADATIANVFIVKDGIAKTPSLDEGGINGVMRRYLLENLASIGVEAAEVPLTVADLMEADELFLTNSISGIRWVKQLGSKNYQNKIAAYIHKKLIKERLLLLTT
ncbi:aminotransferase class IV [Parasediminibacterium sp. JCM 36343]|uniref:aminotransferase class IV n=1 Tax=Parasediminibacterium sp. JCM 36343 TaxID=3374279 RepID=UPI003978BCCE